MQCVARCTIKHEILVTFCLYLQGNRIRIGTDERGAKPPVGRLQERCRSKAIFMASHFQHRTENRGQRKKTKHGEGIQRESRKGAERNLYGCSGR